MADFAPQFFPRMLRFDGTARLLLITPGPHGSEILPALIGAFPTHSLTALESSLDRLRQIGARIKRVRGTATRLPFKKHSFDAVVSFEALYSIRPPWTTLAEFHRVLAPNGVLVLCERSAHGFFSALRDKLTGPGKRVFSIEEIKFRLARADFQIESIESVENMSTLNAPAYVVRAVKIENPAEPVPQFLTAKEMMERRKKVPPVGEELP
jgi:ubiquinone/menaquinone biosynthesis C-methylase UbiE